MARTASSTIGPSPSSTGRCIATYWGGRLPPATGQSGVAHAERPWLVVVRRVSAGVMPLAPGGSPFPVAERGRRLRMPDGPALGRFECPLRCVPAPGRPSRYLPARILVVAPLAPADERAVLLHEMIHAAQYFLFGNDRGHGPIFLAELARLAGLGETWAESELTEYGDAARSPDRAVTGK